MSAVLGARGAIVSPSSDKRRVKQINCHSFSKYIPRYVLYPSVWFAERENHERKDSWPAELVTTVHSTSFSNLDRKSPICMYCMYLLASTFIRYLAV